MNINVRVISLLIVALLIVIAGCSGGNDGKTETNETPPPSSANQGEENNGDTPKPAEPEPKPKEKFEMLIYAAGVSVDEFDRRWRDALENKFSHITFNYMTSTKGNSISEAVARGEIPDLVRIDIPGLVSYKNLGLLQDLSSLVKQYNYDLTQFDEAFVQDLVLAGHTGELYGLPVPPYFPGVMYYNIDLFDKFGIDHPTDGMSWDEFYSLAQTLSRAEGGVVYRGMSMSFSNVLRDNPYSIPIMHPAEDRLADQDVWQKIFANIKRFYDIPNNSTTEKLADEGRAFGQGNVALFHGQFNIYNPIPEEINWDMVSVPFYEETVKRVGQRGPAYWTVTAQSKHQEESFEVIMEMLSDEIQMTDSRNGIVTTLSDNAIKAALGQDDPILKTKNVNAINYYPPSDTPARRSPEVVDVADGPQTTLMNNTFFRVANNEIDINTALRTIDEELKKMADAERAKQ